MPKSFINKLWPNLSPSNYELKSNPTPDYNCVAWANGVNTEPIDLSLDEDGEPLIYPDLSSLPYIEYFQKEGFVLCEDADFEEGFEKIALYENHKGSFEHVARQLGKDLWTSKLGEWEDIQHTSLEALAYRNYYGTPKWYMKRLIT